MIESILSSTSIIIKIHDINMSICSNINKISHHCRYHNIEKISIPTDHNVNSRFFIDLIGFLFFHESGYAAHIIRAIDQIIPTRNVRFIFMF
jgi:hypothetical protein